MRPARERLPADFRNAEARARHVATASERRVAPAVLNALRAQANRYGSSAARVANLDALGQPGTSVVVTGQQVGLFLGPLYSFYKAATAIVVARALSEETKTRVVPVFWLQSEDHDFEEINHFEVFGADGELHRFACAGVDDRSSLASRVLGDDVADALKVLEDVLGQLAHRNEVMALFRAAYRPGAGWVDAFAQVMSSLFADEGLVMLNPRDAAIAECAKPLHVRAFAEHVSIVTVLKNRAAELEREGFAVQVPIRGDVSLPFVHLEGLDGPRFRVDPSKTDVTSLEPLAFSSSALWRPFVQDTLLPTAAYVGGPGELNYFAQLSGLYAHLGLPMPMIIPRARFRVVEARERALLKDLGLDAADLEKSRDEVLKMVTPVTEGLSPAAFSERALGALEPLLASIPTGDTALDKGLKRTRATVDRAVQRLASRYAHHLRTRDEVRVNRVDRLQRALAPQGKPQERVLSIPLLLARHGIAEFKKSVLEAIEPFAPTLIELQP